MIDLFIDRWTYPCAQPQSPGVVSLVAVLRYNRRGEIAVEEPGGEVDSFAEPRAEGVAACTGASVIAARASRGMPAGD
jgi:hypothetical protein